MSTKARGQVTLAVTVDVSSVTRYYLLQSSTLTKPAKPTAATPSSSWTTTEPTYSEGSTSSLYACDRTTLSDGSFAWSDVSLSSSYEAAKAAYNKATAAGTVAAAIKSFFFHDSAGAHVATTADSPDTGFNALWTATKLAFRSATTELMTISAELIELGKNSTSAVISMCGGKFRLAFEKVFSSDTESSAVISSASSLALKSERGSNLAYVHTVSADDVASGTNVVAQGAQLHAMVNTSSYDDFGGAEAGMYVSCSQGTSMHTAQITIVSGCTDKTGADVAPLLIVTSGAKSAMVPLDVLRMEVSRTVLFDNPSQAMNTAVTLSETAADFSDMRIYFKTDDGAYSSMDVHDPNGKIVTCTTNYWNGAAMYVKSKSLKISGTSINTYYNGNAYCTGIYSAAGGLNNTGDYIAVTRVVGWR